MRNVVYLEVRQYIYTENVYTDENGNVLKRERNYDDSWYDTESTEQLSWEEVKDLGFD